MRSRVITLLAAYTLAQTAIGQVTNLPISAKSVTTITRTLSDGTEEVRQSFSRFYRSVNGSTLTVKYADASLDGPAISARLFDALALKVYSIDFTKRTYTVVNSPKLQAPSLASASGKDPGNTIVGGLPCLMVAMAGEGLTQTSSACQSKEFGVSLRTVTVTSSPTMTVVTEYSSLQHEPNQDPTLFAIPAGFTEVVGTFR